LEKQMPAYTNILYYLIVVFVVAGLIWAYFLPVELSVPGQGYVTFLGEPYAISAPADGTVESIEPRNASDVQRGEKILTALRLEADQTNSAQDMQGTQSIQAAHGKQDQQDQKRQVSVTAPAPGVLLWQRDLIKGDRVHVGERLALIYPSSLIGIKVLLPEKDLGRVQLGMPVRVQLPAYPVQTFGVIEGVVQDRVLQYDPKSGREMEVALLVAFEKIPDSRIQLSPGLSAYVEIITGKTSLLKKLLF